MVHYVWEYFSLVIVMVQVIALVNNEYSIIRNELVFLDNSVNKVKCVQKFF